MNNLPKYKQEISEQGYTVIGDLFTDEEICEIIRIINQSDFSKPNFRKSDALFAIRQFFKEVPEVVPHILNENLISLVNELFGEDYFIVKSIYFDKPGDSNWFVSYHQDLTISVNQKAAIEGFGPWTTKQNQFAVQSPIDILKQNFTIRIHLDDTDITNGALRVIPGSHSKGIYRPETIDWSIEQEATCNVRRGGIMIMKPLLLHASGRTTNNLQRRVIHIEFSNQQLPEPLKWPEFQCLK